MSLRIAHLADLHVGFRAFDRDAPGGGNQREADVAEALRRVIDGVIAAAPELVLIAGDVFHSVRPTNQAILRLFAELQRLRTALPAAPVVMIAGDHDAPRSSDGSSILGLYRALGVHVVERGVERVEVAGLSVLCVPKAYAAFYRAWKPGAGFDGAMGAADVLLLHGEVRHVPGAQLEADFLDAGGFEYVALGHYHVAMRVGDRAWYAGSLDYTSTDPWDELRAQERLGVAGKGWLLAEVDGLHEPRVTFQPIEPPRRFVDLAVLDGDGMGAAELDAAIGRALEGAGVDGAVARFRIGNVSRATQRVLDHAALRRWKARALHLALEFGRPAADGLADAEARAVRRRRLEHLVDDYLAGLGLPGDVDRAELRKLGQEYLAAGGSGEQ